MSSTRFVHDPDRIFPDHAYAPGYEPVQREASLEAPPERILGPADMFRFAVAAVMVAGVLALLSALILAR